MPIISIDGPEAVNIRKQNAFAAWGQRNTDNRVEPLAQPSFDVPFQLEPGESIFTIGSCFARNVESELVKRGFRVPMREIFSTPAFEGLDTAIVNNFGTPSIFNELAWAFGEQPFNPDAAFCEVKPDKFVDLHMVNGIRAASLERVKALRQGLFTATRKLAECRVLIMTLGLVELWWDKHNELYLNTAPLPSILNNEPDRFALHVLSYEECYGFLRRALEIAIKHGRDDLNIILTVSPVPLMATHRPQDVMTANCYSKSALRTAAEHVVLEFPQISYFPSYESVSLSDRRIAWMDDLVHVSREIVAFNVERMVNAFSGVETQDTEKDAVARFDAEETGEGLVMAHKARTARAEGDAAFFAEHANWSAKSVAVAIEHARFLFEQNQLTDALALVTGSSDPSAIVLCGEIQLALADYDAAIETLRPICTNKVKGRLQWLVMVEALTAKKDIEGLLDLEKKWLMIRSTQKSASLRIGKAFSTLERFDLAAPRLEKAIDLDGSDNPMHIFEYAVALIELERFAEALELLDQPMELNDRQGVRADKLRTAARKGMGASA